MVSDTLVRMGHHEIARNIRNRYRLPKEESATH